MNSKIVLANLHIVDNESFTTKKNKRHIPKKIIQIIPINEKNYEICPPFELSVIDSQGFIKNLEK